MATVHVVGAGLAGLSCAIHLAARRRRIVLYEATGRAGGRCRSFYDKTLERTIDNGNHLLLSGNSEVAAYLAAIDAQDELTGPDEATFPFFDLADGQRWTLRLNSGPVPWWIVVPGRSVPGTRLRDYIQALKLVRAASDATVAACLGEEGTLYRRFWEPFAVAVLNTPAPSGSARLLWAVVRETFVRGGRACRPLIARRSLSDTFVDPALRHLAASGVTVMFNRRLRALKRANGRIRALHMTDECVELEGGDTVVLALPPWEIARLLPEVASPRASHAIVNAHFRIARKPRAVLPFLGLVGATAQWVFIRDDVVSVTVSAADALALEEPAAIAARLWPEVAQALELPANPLPPYRIIKEKRATFAQTPDAVRHRPGPRTPLANLVLAGDWTDTGLPATIEGALRSGRSAADAVVAL